MNRTPLVFLAMALFLAIPPRLRAEDPATAILDRAERAGRADISGGQAIPGFWDGCDTGTEIEFRQESRVKGETHASATSYRIVKRGEGSLVLRVTSGDQDRTFDLFEKGTGVEFVGVGGGPAREQPVDAKLPDRETLTIEGTPHACDVYERTLKLYPQCGTGEPQYRLHRLRAWHCAEVPVQGGILKTVATQEEEWGSGLETRLRTELLVTDIAVPKKVGDAEVEAYAVTVTTTQAEEGGHGKSPGAANARREPVVVAEVKQIRLDTSPGGVLESLQTLRNSDGKGEPYLYRHWVERMSLVRVAEVEKR